MLLATGLLLVASNLRVGVASVGPVVADIQDHIGVGPIAVGALTSIPVLAFGLFAFAAPTLIRRTGLHRLLGLAMLVLLGGILLRLHPSILALFAGTVLVGAAIAVSNVIMPAAVKEGFPQRTGLMMGLYSTALFVGAALASGLTVPLATATGGDWRTALACWSIPVAVAAVVWMPQMLRRPGNTGRGRVAAPRGAGEPEFRALLTDPTAIAVTIFMGAQSTAYYATLAWLPALLQDAGMTAAEAGWMLAFTAVPGTVASLITPVIARRIRPVWLPMLLAGAMTATAYAGLVTHAVSGAYLWMALLGIGQGASLSLGLSYIVWRSPDVHHTGQLSTMAQGFGYLLASLGPLSLGALHAVTDDWVGPIAALCALLTAQLIAGAVASRERHILVAPGESGPR